MVGTHDQVRIFQECVCQIFRTPFISPVRRFTGGPDERNTLGNALGAEACGIVWC